MNILVISASKPHPSHSIRAANIVIFELLKSLSKLNPGKLGLLVVSQDDQSKDSADEKIGIDELKTTGIDILPTIKLPEIDARRSKIFRFLFPKIEDRYPEKIFSKLIEDRIRSWNADAIIIPWSEMLTFVCSEIKILKYAYYGNPEPKVLLANLEIRFKSKKMSRIRIFFEQARIKRIEKFHLMTLRKYDFLGNVAKNDAQYYSNSGHQNSFYIQNIWPQTHSSFRDNSQKTKSGLKIIGNLGKIGGTANILGLEYLGNQIMPALDKFLSDVEYQVHIFGFGEPHKLHLPTQNHKKIIWRGFVEDIDSNLLNCDIFLCVNNATNFKVGHTRFLHAWSLGIPVVAHRDVSLSMPEIQHEVNALLGSDPDEIALQIKRLIEEPTLRNQLINSGYETLSQYFNPDTVAKKIISSLQTFERIN